MPQFLSAPTPDWLCSYNGFTFDPAYSKTTGIVVRPVDDPSGRTAIANDYSIRVRSWLFGTDTDSVATAARQRLTAQGQEFRYRGRGLGNLDVNVGGRKDVMWGPKVRELGLRPAGPGNAVQIDWEVSFRVPDCPVAKFEFALMYFVYRVEFRIRRNGRQDRVVTGELAVPNNRRTPTSRKLKDSPDDYREDILPPVPERFRREFQPWVIDESRTKLNFGWTDSEFDGPAYPVGVVDAEVQHTVRSTNVGLVAYTSNLSGTYELAAGYPVEAAERAFFDVVKDRMLDARQRYGDAVTFLPIAFEFTNPNLYGPPRPSFSLTWTIQGKTSVREILEQSGAYRPVPGSDWKQWEASLRDSALNPYGYSRLRFKVDEDAVIDLCKEEYGTPSRPPSRNGLRQLFGFPGGIGMGWLVWENAFRVEVDSGLVEMRTLPQKTPVDTPKPKTKRRPFDAEMRQGQFPAQPPPQGGQGGVDNPWVQIWPPGPGSQAFIDQMLAEAWRQVWAGMTGGRVPKPDAPAPPGQAGGRIENDLAGDTLRSQRRTGPACHVYMEGRALRVGFPINPPELVDVEGVAPVASNREDRGEGFVTKIVGNAGMPIYGAWWRLRYWLPKIPDRPITPPPNPMLGG